MASTVPAETAEPTLDARVCPPEAGLAAQQSEEALEKVLETRKRLADSSWGDPRPPVFLFPGLASSRLVAWKAKKCIGPDINVQDNLWLNVQKVVETLTFDPRCWLDCLKLGPNQTDPEDCRVRPGDGLDAVSVLSPGLFTEKPTSVYNNLISYISEAYGYDKNSIIGFPYDWRLSPGKLEERDGFFSSTKARIEAAVQLNGRPGIVFAHSMGNNCILYFFKWLKLRFPRSWESWLTKHIWTYVALAPPLLGAISPLKSVLTGEPMGLPITERMARDLELSWSVTHWVNPLPVGDFNPPRPYAVRESASRQVSQVNSTAAFASARKAPEDGRGTKGPLWDEDIIRVQVKEGRAEAIFGAEDVTTGELFRWLGAIYNDDALIRKYLSLQHDYLGSDVNYFEGPPMRPPVKHVIMAYGIDLPTEKKYVYSNDPRQDYPIMKEMVVEESGEEWLVRMGRRTKQKLRHGTSDLQHSGDGLIPYYSLSWSHSWLGQNVSVSSSERQTFKKSNFLDNWTPSSVDMAATVTRPAVRCLHGSGSQEVDRPGVGAPTTIIEMEGVSHHKITSSSDVMRVVWDLLVGEAPERMVRGPQR
eukprot:scaffold952_cov249-Pinguiococcus_pyrenoidosus.AAC.17